MSAVSKSELLENCLDHVSKQLSELESAMAKVKESMVSEEKSSAGDKFETARAMAHKEMEILSAQMDKARIDYGVLSQIDPQSKNPQIQLGSLVQTESKHLLIAVALGRISIQNEDVFVVSPTSPIAQIMLGKEQGHAFQMGGKADRVSSVI